MLNIRNLTKSYGNVKAVDDLTLEIRPGEICGFIGHNGAGKTTTIKCICGILPFEKGDIQVNGISVREDPLTCKKNISYIPDNPDIYGGDSSVRQERIHRIADQLDLTKDLNQSVGAYSHGMKQKLVIISALIHDPKLIIMDEPFVGLDPTASYQLKQLMREHCKQGGSIFFSTHVLDVAEKLCDQVAIIKSGKLIRNGTMEEVRGDSSLESVFLELEEQ